MNQLIEIRLFKELQYFNLDINLKLSATSITTICGHSGSGKTTLLRAITGLEKCVGKVVVNNKIWQDEINFLPTYKRRVGFVFQEANLFSHLSVEKNLNYSLSRNPNSRFNFSEILELLKIDHLLKRDPHNLSGGEKQRVAIARALFSNPSILLMDEPLSSLDENNKLQILNYLKKINSIYQLPIIYVTHSIEEVQYLAAKTIHLSQGKILKKN